MSTLVRLRQRCRLIPLSRQVPHGTSSRPQHAPLRRSRHYSLPSVQQTVYRLDSGRYADAFEQTKVVVGVVGVASRPEADVWGRGITL